MQLIVSCVAVFTTIPGSIGVLVVEVSYEFNLQTSSLMFSTTHCMAQLALNKMLSSDWLSTDLIVYNGFVQHQSQSVQQIECQTRLCPTGVYYNRKPFNQRHFSSSFSVSLINKPSFSDHYKRNKCLHTCVLTVKK